MALQATRMNGEINEDEYQLQELLSSPSGFERYAAEKLPEFIQVQRDYEGFVRDVITVTEVDPRDLVRVNEEVFVVYSKDVDSVAAILPRYGEAPTQIVRGETVKVTFYQITTPRITMSQFDIDTQPYDIMRRAQEKAGQAIAKMEDESFLKTADMLVENNKSQTTKQSEVEITKAGLVSLKQIFSRNDVAFASYLMNPATYDSFLLWGEEDLDPTSQRSIFETGQLPTIWGGIKMITGIVVPEKYVYGLAPKEILGRMPILRDITTEVQKLPEKQEKEVIAYEIIGMFIHSHLAVARLELGAE